MSIIRILKISRPDCSCTHGAMSPCLSPRSEDVSAQRGGYSMLLKIVKKNGLTSSRTPN
jgi:hypothetical protein